jgi:PTS system nitrogen regulatory IIA component
LRRLQGILARLQQPIEFDAIDGRAVDIVFVLMLPANAENKNLNALALVARKLRSPEILDRLRGAQDASELYRAMVKDDAV